jgi:hypothetical protein
MSCATPLTLEVLIDYFAGDLPDAASDRVDEHLLSCERCANEAAQLVPLIMGLERHIPYVLSKTGLGVLQRRQTRVALSDVASSEPALVPFPEDADVLVIRLKAHFGDVERVDCELQLLDGTPILSIPDVPFDREAGVHMACQQHFITRFGSHPFEVRLYGRKRDGDAPRTELAQFTLRHQ